jgi:hypothetical protein
MLDNLSLRKNVYYQFRCEFLFDFLYEHILLLLVSHFNWHNVAFALTLILPVSSSVFFTFVNSYKLLNCRRLRKPFGDETNCISFFRFNFSFNESLTTNDITVRTVVDCANYLFNPDLFCISNKKKFSKFWKSPEIVLILKTY